MTAEIDSFEEEQKVREIEQHPYLVYFSQKEEITKDYYSVVKSTKIVDEGRDKYGHYRETEETIIFHQYESQEKRKDHLVTVAEDQDYNHRTEVLESGKVPDYFKNMTIKLL